MSQTLEKLTPEQEVILEETYQDWLKRGYRTEPMDREKATECIKNIYGLLNLPVPPIEFVTGPKEALKVFRAQGEEGNIHPHLIGGCWHSTYLSVHEFARKIGTEYNEKDEAEMDIWLEVSKNIHLFMPFEEMAIVIDYPTTLTVDEQGNLHNENGPSLAYADGYQVFAWHGTIIMEPEKHYIITNPEQITHTKIDDENNMEIKRVMLTRLGIENYLAGGDAEFIHEDSYGKLMRKPIKGTDLEQVFALVQNSTPEPDGSIKPYILPVDSQLRPLLSDTEFGAPQAMTCKNAIASTFGLRGEEYDLVAQS
jgi:hypothetical protein